MFREAIFTPHYEFSILFAIYSKQALHYRPHIYYHLRHFYSERNMGNVILLPVLLCIIFPNLFTNLFHFVSGEARMRSSYCVLGLICSCPLEKHFPQHFLPTVQFIFSSHTTTGLFEPNSFIFHTYTQEYTNTHAEKKEMNKGNTYLHSCAHFSVLTHCVRIRSDPFWRVHDALGLIRFESFSVRKALPFCRWSTLMISYSCNMPVNPGLKL